MSELIELVKQEFGGLAPGAEICAEMDPGTFDAERLKRFLDIGLTRISMGVQVSTALALMLGLMIKARVGIRVRVDKNAVGAWRTGSMLTPSRSVERCGAADTAAVLCSRAVWCSVQTPAAALCWRALYGADAAAADTAAVLCRRSTAAVLHRRGCPPALSKLRRCCDCPTTVVPQRQPTGVSVTCLKYMNTSSLQRYSAAMTRGAAGRCLALFSAAQL
eukprot:TRINITY_DN1857_c0_g1_i2.p1 TRINITY_DN1857_c0_g1~~TRINITY_DN1857_c0_g1_i2.p1  ORF type:complete len:219 (-),score=20.66 TRINITY_DN1857_c0_g1_i2:32-688(-)